MLRTRLSSARHQSVAAFELRVDAFLDVAEAVRARHHGELEIDLVEVLALEDVPGQDAEAAQRRRGSASGPPGAVKRMTLFDRTSGGSNLSRLTLWTPVRFLGSMMASNVQRTSSAVIGLAVAPAGARRRSRT